MVIAEMSPDKLWSFLAHLKSSGESGNVGIPEQRPADDGVRATAKQALLSNKGAGWAARLFEDCAVAELPATVVTFLNQVYGFFPKPPDPVPVEGNKPDEVVAPAAAVQNQNGVQAV
jgi:putative ATP-dependent endonuclease of OLD family